MNVQRQVSTSTLIKIEHFSVSIQIIKILVLALPTAKLMGWPIPRFNKGMNDFVSIPTDQRVLRLSALFTLRCIEKAKLINWSR